MTGGTDAGEDAVGLAAWQAARDAVLAAVTNRTLARTYDVSCGSLRGWRTSRGGRRRTRRRWRMARRWDGQGDLGGGLLRTMWTSLQSLLGLCSA